MAPLSLSKKKQITRTFHNTDPLPPSALIRGRHVVNKDFVPMEPSKRKELRLEDDIMKTCTDASKILPIPTLNRRHYKQVLDKIGEQLSIRFNLSSMEEEDRRMKKWMREEKRRIIQSRGAADAAKAQKALVMFLKRAMVAAYHQWKDYTQKTNKARRFMKKILLGEKQRVFDTFQWVRDTLKEIKRNGVTLLQASIRKFVCVKKYARLVVKGRAKISIVRGWRAYCARNMLSRMIRKREEEEKRIKLQLRKIYGRILLKILLSWRQHTQIMRFANMMGAGSIRKKMKYMFQRWCSEVVRVIHAKPLAAKRIQRMTRRRWNIQRWSRIMTMHGASKPIQRMIRARLVKTMLLRMKKKKEDLMKRVRKRMRADTDRILTMCMSILSNNATTRIEHRKKLGGFVALKTKRLIAQWRKVVVNQILERNQACVKIQKCYRGLLGRRLGEMVRVAKQRKMDSTNKARQLNDLNELMKDRGPKLDPITGLPIIGRETKRLKALLDEKIEVAKVLEKSKKIQEKASSKFASKENKKKAKELEKIQFDSKVLSFSQRFRLRTDTTFLVGFLDDEIKKETWRIWSEDRKKELEASARIKEAIEADEKRAEEMRVMLEAANQKRANNGSMPNQNQKEDPAYPTAGIFLSFKKAKEEEMLEALRSWGDLLDGGYLPRQVMIGWVARGIMDQDKPTQRVVAWKCVKKVLNENLLWDINMLIGDIKRETKEDEEKGMKKRKKKKDGTTDLNGMGEVARRRRWRGRDTTSL